MTSFENAAGQHTPDRHMSHNIHVTHWVHCTPAY